MVAMLAFSAAAAAQDENKCKPGLGNEPQLCLLKEQDGQVEYLLDLAKNERYDEWPQNLVYKGNGDFFLDVWMVAFEVATPENRTYYARTLHFNPDEAGGYAIKDFLTGVCLVIDGKEAGHKSVMPRWEVIDDSFAGERQTCHVLLQYYRANETMILAKP